MLDIDAADENDSSSEEEENTEEIAEAMENEARMREFMFQGLAQHTENRSGIVVFNPNQPSTNPISR